MDKVIGESTPPPIPETVKVSQEFQITSYSSLNGIGSGKYLASDRFAVDGHDFAVYFYPDGKNADDGGAYVSIFIVLVSEASKNVKALFELGVLDQSGNQKHIVHSHFHTMPECGPYMLTCSGSMWGGGREWPACAMATPKILGYKRFLKKTDLETLGYLKDDCLIVNCSVGVVRSEDTHRGT
ncbi:BTB/POZ and MATH domain-containing protein 5-like isoform X1 [Lotus japonicus]|uniref:BTB/POZ and MATH domain-containing protein 5-like isoform X1 n=1 Tax=Lotus japonicus TaxID=34305 RepID=UPI00258AC781|nr:BTB/POZ and MATH domain-containing protein 5-like isoform X1 [Lotus japonicus]